MRVLNVVGCGGWADEWKTFLLILLSVTDASEQGKQAVHLDGQTLACEFDCKS